MITISIIVPVYNIKNYIEECIESLIHQTYEKVEIVLVDDGSTDGSSLICDNYAKKDRRIKVIHKENGGLVSARKTGLQYAHGEYVLNIDGDDWLELNAIEILVRNLHETAVDYIQFSYVREEKNSKVVHVPIFEKRLDKVQRINIFKAWLSEADIISSCIVNKLIKKGIFQKSYETVPNFMSRGEDFANFVYMITYSERIISIDEPLYHYRIRNDSLSHNSNPTIDSRYDMLTDYIVNQAYNLGLVSSDDIYIWALKRKNRLMSSELRRFGVDIPVYKLPRVSELLKKKVIIYGAGKVGQDYYAQLCKYKEIEIVGWVDRNYKSVYIDYYELKPVEQVLKEDFNIIIIAILDEKTRNRIEVDLQRNFGVVKKRILNTEPISIIDPL